MSKKTRTVTALLCFFLGFIGIHRFYVGKPGTAILWLLTCGFLGVGVVVDLILILSGKFTDHDGKKIEIWA